MNKFITASEASKKVLSIAQMSANLPVNVLIIGETGVGKKKLAQEVFNEIPLFEAKKLEALIINKTINISEYSQIIVLHLELVLNKKQFIKSLEGIRIIATTRNIVSDMSSEFAIKINVLPLEDRQEDLEELTKIYIQEVEKIYNKDIDTTKIEINLSHNGISLKQSIYKSLSLSTLTDEEIMHGLEIFLLKKLDDGSDYQKLLKYFEVPLLNAAKIKYKSQSQMANHLNLNRNTLRKKINLYLGDN